MLGGPPGVHALEGSTECLGRSERMVAEDIGQPMGRDRLAHRVMGVGQRAGRQVRGGPT